MSTLAASMVRRPPVGIASRAFTARLMMICSIWPGSAFTTPRSRASTVVSWMSSPISRLSSFSVPATVAFSCLADLVDIVAFGIVRPEILEQQGAVTGDHGQQVVEIVGDPTGQTAD